MFIVSLFLVVRTTDLYIPVSTDRWLEPSAIDCVERLIYEMALCRVGRRTLHTHSLICKLFHHSQKLARRAKSYTKLSMFPSAKLSTNHQEPSHSRRCSKCLKQSAACSTSGNGYSPPDIDIFPSGNSPSFYLAHQHKAINTKY